MTQQFKKGDLVQFADDDELPPLRFRVRQAGQRISCRSICKDGTLSKGSYLFEPSILKHAQQDVDKNLTKDHREGMSLTRS